MNGAELSMVYQQVLDPTGTSVRLHMVTKAIAEQLSEFRASMSEDSPVTSVPSKGYLEDDEATWWGSWRKRLRTEEGYVKIGKDQSSRRRKSSGGSKKVDGPELADMDVDVKPSAVGEGEMEKELRVVLKAGFSTCDFLSAC